MIPELDIFPHSFIGGAHGIEASHAGAFLAPIGDLGLLVLAYDDRQANAHIACHQDARLNFYRLIRLGDGPDGEVFACGGTPGRTRGRQLRGRDTHRSP